MMAHLSARLLGPLCVTLNDERVTGFESDKARALFAYLVVETERPQRREKLAALLWPDRSQRAARANLRHTLANLRQILGDRGRAADPVLHTPFLRASRHTIQVNTESNIWVDATEFSELVKVGGLSAAVTELKQAVRLYRGDFLEGFSVDDSAAFEKWVLLRRERLHRLAIEALQRLADRYERRGEWKRALPHAWRQVELDPWRERAHRQLMRLLALSGQRGAALAQYESCRRLLDKELGVEPAKETIRLYEQIRDEELEAPVPPPVAAVETPSFLYEKQAVEGQRPVFVAREPELAELDRHLALALAGKARVVFVTGEAGSGKTALIQAFTQRAQDAYGDLVVASGDCSAYTGVGDPYLPFRQILQLLTGDVEARWTAGAITQEHARRLWRTVPLAIEALAEAGPDLIDTLVPGSDLLKHAALVSSAAVEGTARADAAESARWLTRLEELAKRKAITRDGPAPRQSALFEQVTGVLQAVALQRPLVLVLDDLQWADAGSIHLLFHLAQQVTGNRILTVGAYRPEDVALGRRGERHPLEPVVHELRRDFGDITVDLDRAAGREFMDAFLNTEPNRLGRRFRSMLYRQTRGHPLFTIELLRGLRERGDLEQDRQGHWVARPNLDWETLPARAEAVIAERVARLDQPLRAALQVASVEGETFTAEVVAWVRGLDEQDMLRCLSAELGRGHRLVQADRIQRVGGHTVSRYRFRHVLFQKYLYSTLHEVERAHLHERVGNALERLYTAHDRTAVVAPQLARHYDEAGMTHKAVRYLRQAARRALQLSAYQEAVRHLSRGLSLLETLPHSFEVAEQELALQRALGKAYVGESGTQAPEVREAYARARELCLETGKTSQLGQVLGELSVHHYVRAEYQRARDMTEEALRSAREADDPLLVTLGHWYLGIILFPLGDYAGARTHLQQTRSWYDPQEHHRPLVNLRGSDVGPSALSYEACCLWCLGYPDQGLKQSQKALALAKELNHPYSLADVLTYAGCFFNSLLGDAQALKRHAEELILLSDETGFRSWSVTGTFHLGEALAMMGKVEEGIARMRSALAVWQSLGVRCYATSVLGPVARAQAEAGLVEEAVATVEEALGLVEETEERFYEAELHRLRGDLLHEQGDEAEAEASFDKAIEVARGQRAKSWELRATMGMCRLLRQQGRVEEARRRLAELYSWFTEGFDTPDLKGAKSHLEALLS